MSNLNFPASPLVGDIYSLNGKTWRWNGISWKSYNSLGIAQGGTGLTGIDAGNAVLSSNSAGTALTYRTFIAGSGISILFGPSSVTFTSTGGTSGSGSTGSGTVGQGNAYELAWYESAGTSVTSSGSGLTWDRANQILSVRGNDAYVIIENSAGVAGIKDGLVLKSTQIVDGINTYSISPHLNFISNYYENTSKQAKFSLNSASYSSNDSRFTLDYDINNYTASIFQAFGSTSGLNSYFHFDVDVTGQNAYFDYDVGIGKTLFLYNTASNKIGIRAPSTATGATVYVLPSSTPATGTSVLQSTSAGILSWVPMVATGGGSGGSGVVYDGQAFDIPYYPSAGTSITGSSNFKNVGTGISILYTANSINTSTGSLVVNGGVGIAGTVNASGNISARSGFELRVFDPTNVYYSGFKFTGAVNSLYTLPTSFPSTGTSVLQSDTSGNLTWVSFTSGGGSGSVNSGTAGSVAFYSTDGSTVSGSPVLFISSGNGLTVNPSTSSISTSTGALVVRGGVGIGGSLYVASATAISGVTINNGIITGSLTGTATSAQNLNVAALGTTTTDHFLLLSPRNTGSGVAVSSGFGLSFTPSSSTLKIGGLGLSTTALTSTAATLTLFSSTSTTVNAFQAGTAISFGAATGTLTVNNATLRANQTTASINTTSGSIIAAGGVGIGGSLYVGGTASSVSGLVVNSSIVTSGTWSATAITSRYGGTGYITYSTGDILVGTGSTLTTQPVGTNNYVLIADNSQPTNLRWGLVSNSSLQNSFIGFGATTIGLGTTLNVVAGSGISFLYSGNTLTVYNRGGVLITSTYPLSPLQGDLFWHDEEGVLKVYYDDTDGPGQWVDANQRWGQGQYVTFPDLGSGDLYEVAYYSGAGHSVNGANNFTNNTSTNQVAITYSTGSTSSSTGAFVVSGGVGIGGSLYANTVVSNSGFVENVYNGGTAGTGTTIYPNWSQGSVQSYTLAGNCWLGLPTNMPTGASLTLIISQNATGGWAMTSDSNIKYAGGSKTVSTGASVIDVINMFYTGSTYLAALTTGYS